MLATKLKVVSNDGTRNPVYRSVSRFAIEGLGDLIRVLMENVDDVLFELADKVDNDRERNRYFEAMREIRLKRDALKRQFDEELRQCFAVALHGEAQASADEDDTELTLIEYDDLEDNIAIGNMISRARPQFEDELFAVSARLKLVLKRSELEADDNPFDPQAICNCFHNAAELLETDIQVKLIFYKLFERYVINNLGHFYGEVNALFVDKGVLPGFKVDQERMKQTTRFMANRIKTSPSPPAVGGVATTAAAGDGSNLFATLQQAISGTADAAGITYAPADQVASGDLVSALGSLQTVALGHQAVDSIDPQNMRAVTRQQILGFRKQHQHQFNGTDNQTIDVVSMLFDFFFDDAALPAPIKVLIGRLQIPILKVAMIDKDFFNHKKHPARKLLDCISRASLGWSVNPGDEQALIDKTEEIVNFLVNEFDSDIGVFEEAWINLENFIRQQESESEDRLQEITRQEQEKDRQIECARAATASLIDKLIGNRGLSDEIIDFLETTWSAVLFNTHLSLGEASNHWRNLNRISTTFVWTLTPRHSEAERVKIIKTIPALLRALAKGMELIGIRRDVQNRIFQTLAGEHARIVKLTSRNIVTRVDDSTVWPEEAAAGAFARASEIDPIVTADDPQVVDCEADDDFISIVSTAMTEDVIDDLDLFTRGVQVGEIVVDEEIVLESEDGGDCDLFDTGEDHLAQARALEIGSWVEFNQAQSRALIARLSWKSNVTENLVFANRQGHKVRNMTINNLAAEFASGRARCIESSSVFDRAIYTIMAKI